MSILDKFYDSKTDEVKVKNIIITAVILPLVIFLFFNMGIMYVDTGHRGIKVTTGSVSDQSLEEGIHLYMPFISKIVQMDTRVQRKDFKTEVYTKDIQKATISYSVNYNLDKNRAHVMYKEVGQDWEEKVMIPVLEGILKNVIGKWEATEVVENRDRATTDIVTQLKSVLQDRFVNVISFQIINIDYSDDFENAIEEKVKAEQDALTSKNKTVQVEEEAKQKVIAAQAEAKSMTIRAQALSQNKNLVEYEAVQKWNGELPNILMSSDKGGIPFININGTDGTK